MSLKSTLTTKRNFRQARNYTNATKNDINGDIEAAFNKIIDGAQMLQNIALGCIQRDGAAELGAVLMGIAADVYDVSADVASIEGDIMNNTWGAALRNASARTYYREGFRSLPSAYQQKIQLEQRVSELNRKRRSTNKRL